MWEVGMYLKNFKNIPVDVATLEGCFPEHKALNGKLSSLEKSGELIRLKKGLYVVAPEVSGVLIDLNLVANHIYGPSYVSMETALAYYGLIPERVYQVKSITLKHSRYFENSLANFLYTQATPEYYSIGLNVVVKDGYGFLIASPEKALCDLIVSTPNLHPRFKSAMYEFLESDLRLDMDAFFRMDVAIVNQVLTCCKKKQDVDLLRRMLE